MPAVSLTLIVVPLSNALDAHTYLIVLRLKQFKLEKLSYFFY